MNEAMAFKPKYLYMNRLNAAMFMEHGGPHLGAVRGQIQIMFRNGEHVIWGSRDELSPPATVKDLEKLAAHVAESVLRNVHEYMPKNNVFNQLQILKTAVEEAIEYPKKMLSILKDALAKTTECTCGNLPHHFDCTCEWSHRHPGDRIFTCEFCGIYNADKPRCNKCEESES